MIFADYLTALNIPVYAVAMFGHVPEELTVPLGIDTERVHISLLQPAVSVRSPGPALCTILTLNDT